MDSLTQAALGAAVGTAVMGRHRPVWQAALTGAAVGTLPDLDVFVDKGDAIRNMVLHRAETHAFFWQALATPFIAGLLALLTGSRALYGRWCLMVLLGLFTHSLLDGATVYGTQLGLPFSNYPFGMASLFIIDPLYTLPLLVGLIGALIIRAPRRFHWNTAGLVISTLYAGWAIAAQAHVTDKAVLTAHAQGLPTEKILVTPTPFNTLLWRVVVMGDEHYHEGFYSLLDAHEQGREPISFAAHPRGAALDERTAGFTDADPIRRFSKGFYSLADDGRHVRITDLRMGQHPHFAFAFAFAEHQSEPLLAIEPIRFTQRMPVDRGLDWLWRRMLGERLPPPA